MYALYLGLLFLVQRWMIFPGQFRDPPDISTAVLDATGGRALSSARAGKSWWFAGDPHRPALAVFHGNGEIIEDWLATAANLRSQGYNVLLVEYPGYGGSPGAPTHTTLIENARRAMNEAKPLHDGPWIAVGISLGTGVATALARDGSFDAVALIAPYSSMTAMATRRLAPGFLVRDRFDNLAALHGFIKPVLIIHGKKDRSIPPAMASQVAAVCAGPVDLRLLDSHGHQSVLGGDVLDIVTTWVNQIFPLRQQ